MLDPVHTDATAATADDAPLVLVDGGVGAAADWQRGFGPSAEIVTLTGGGDGLAQMVAAAEEHPGATSLHLVSHGASGALVLAGGGPSLESLADDRPLLHELGAALAPGADLMLYGCEVGDGQRGDAFVRGLAHATGLDVAASEDATGGGGDWQLEVTRGDVEARPHAAPELDAPLGTLVVNTTKDVFDAQDKLLSFREAITQANASAAADTITFASGLSGKTVMASGDGFTITRPTTIDGDLDNDGKADVALTCLSDSEFQFSVDQTDASFDGIEIVDGRSSPNYLIVDGYEASIRFTNSIVSGNYGNGIIADGGSLDFSGCSISDNGTEDFASVSIDHGSLRMIKTTISGNYSEIAPAVELIASSGLIVRSTISGNYSYTAQAAGIGAVDSTVTLSNSTVTGNIRSGGIDSDNSSFSIVNSTITDNSSQLGLGGAGLRVHGGSVSVRNAIIADNAAPYGPSEADVAGGVITSNGHNLFGQAAVAGSIAGDLLGADPHLGPLQDNGGPTLTRALLPDSPAIDAGEDAAASGLTTDQRSGGFARISGAHVDIGAFELQQGPAPITGTPGNDSLTGTSGPDIIMGLGGNDTIKGLGGDDGLDGGSGNDGLRGGTGADTLAGGTGADRFAYLTTSDSPSRPAARDLVLDFAHGQGDRIDLAAIDANAAASGDQAFTFIGTKAFTGAGQLHVAYSGGDTLVEANTSGPSSAELQLDVHAHLLASDFVF